MDSEISAWVGAIGGAIGALGGVGAWIVAIRANGRSERANALAESANGTAGKAFDLQARIDARAQEFRDVRWEGGWALAEEDQGVFRLTNVGHTSACGVTVVVDAIKGEDAPRIWKHDRIDPGQSGDGPLGAQYPVTLDLLLHQHPGFEVHWTSPLGAKSQHRDPGLQAY